MDNFTSFYGSYNHLWIILQILWIIGLSSMDHFLGSMDRFPYFMDHLKHFYCSILLKVWIIFHFSMDQVLLFMDHEVSSYGSYYFYFCDIWCEGSTNVQFSIMFKRAFLCFYGTKSIY